MLGGAAILAAPLAPLPLLVRQGVAGVSGYLVGALLVAAGLLSWAQRGQHVFLGVTAIALSLASFVTSNFGGFGIGMTLGLVGGSLLVAWLPAKHPRTPATTACPRPPRYGPAGNGSPGIREAAPSPRAVMTRRYGPGHDDDPRVHGSGSLPPSVMPGPARYHPVHSDQPGVRESGPPPYALLSGSVWCGPVQDDEPGVRESGPPPRTLTPGLAQNNPVGDDPGLGEREPKPPEARPTRNGSAHDDVLRARQAGPPPHAVIVIPAALALLAPVGQLPGRPPYRPAAAVTASAPLPVAAVPPRRGPASLHPGHRHTTPAATDTSAALVPEDLMPMSGVTPGESRLRAVRLVMRGVRFHGAVTHPAAHGPPRLMKLTMTAGRVIEGDHRFSRPGGPVFRQRFSSLTLTGGAVLYATRLRLRVGGVGLTLTAASPAPPPLPAATVTGVEAEGVLLHAARAHVTGLTQHPPD